MKNKILLGFFLLVLAGCATSTRYVSYTPERYMAKAPSLAVNVYPGAPAISPGHSYYIIGQASVEGFAGSGVTSARLTEEAKSIARAKGADAIINAKTVEYRYYSGDILLRFTGDLMVEASVAQTAH